jgi:hypothetical protein
MNHLLRLKQTRKRVGKATALAAVICGCLIASAQCADEGAWKDSTQEVYDATQGTMERRTYRVWDFHPQLHFEFTWEQANRIAGPDGIVNGTGTLTWRKEGTHEYDVTAVQSRYEGEMKNGRPDGYGSLVMRSGLTYAGTWKEGVMDGRGLIKLENGDDYDGEFVAGRMQGQGRYGSADGTVYVGEFKNGVREGTGTLTVAGGASYTTTWRAGVETGRELISGSANPAGQPPEPANRNMSLRILIDRKRNEDFLFHDDASLYHVYDSENLPGKMNVAVATGEITGGWKKDTVIKGYAGAYIDDVAQFAPVYLLADFTNNGIQAARISAAYLDVEESRTDLQPYLYFSRARVICTETGYDPEVIFKNLGWGPIRNARFSYALDGQSRAKPPFSDILGTFDQTKKVSIDDGIRKSGVDIKKVTQTKFTCPTLAQMPVCLARVEASGILGSLAGHLSPSGDAVYANVDGQIDYAWTDADQRDHSRSSKIYYKVPLLVFKIEAPGVAECGGPSAVDHSGTTRALSLDRRNYRIPLDWHAELEARGNARFGVSLVAPKSSAHVFRLVLELSDGRKISSREVDLSYFIPRLARRS